MHLSEQRPRPATRDDIDSIVRLVGEMYADLAEEHTGERPTVRPDWAPLAAEALADRLGIDVMAFVVELPPTGVVAVAVGRLHETLPSPRRATTTAGYLEWVATDVAARRRSCARAAVSSLLDWFDERGAGVVDVHSSASAEALYLGLGFEGGGPVALSRRRERAPF